MKEQYYLQNQYINNNLRNKLDRSYHHQYYSKNREKLQNKIIRKIFSQDNHHQTSSLLQNKECKSNNVWMIVTAGPMGSGKTSTIQYLLESGILPITSPILIDMDQIRDLLPESTYYQQHEPLNYGEKTQLESGCIVELLVHVSLTAKRNIILDGSMMNKEWQKQYFITLKQEYPDLKIILIHIGADPIIIRQRVQVRNQTSKRFVPTEVMERSIERLNSWKTFLDLKDTVEAFVSLQNNDDPMKPIIQYPWHMKFENLKEYLTTTAATDLPERTIPYMSNYAEPTDYLYFSDKTSSCDISPVITADNNEIQVIKESSDDSSYDSTLDNITESALTTSTTTFSFIEPETEADRTDQLLLDTTPSRIVRSPSNKKNLKEKTVCNICRLDKLPCPNLVNSFP